MSRYFLAVFRYRDFVYKLFGFTYGRIDSFLYSKVYVTVFLLATLFACVSTSKVSTLTVVDRVDLDLKEEKMLEPLDEELLNRLKQEVLEKGEHIALFDKFAAENITQFDGFSSEVLLSFAEMKYEKSDAEYRIKLMEYESGVSTEGVPKLDLSETVGFLSKIITARSLDRLMDRFLYLRGFCYEEQGYRDKAAEDYKRLLIEYRDSRLALESAFRLGEYFFDTEQNGLAIETYSILKPFNKSGFYDKALYKLGWSYYKVSRFKEAIIYFLQVADWVYGVSDPKTVAGTKNIKNKQNIYLDNLAGEALKYAAISFAQYGDPGNIAAFLGSVNKPYIKELYLKIAEAYLDQAKFEDAVVTHRNFISLFPLVPEAMSAQIQIISIYKESLRDRVHEFQEREVFIKTYSFGSKWFLKNQDKEELYDILPEMIKETANYYTSIAKKNNDVAIYKKIVSLYRKYLGLFGKEKGGYEINYLLAELLFDLKKYEESSVEYEKAAWEYKNTKYREKAVYGVILSYENVVQLNKAAGLPTDVLTELMVQSIDRYLKHFPDNPKTSLVMMKEGELYFELGKYDKAIDYFLVVLDKAGNKKYFLRIEEYLADSFFNKKDYTAAEKRYRVLLDRARTSNLLKLQKKAVKYIVICALNIADSLKSNGEVLAAAAEFEKAASLAESNKDKEFAIKEAFKIYITARKWKKFDALFSQYKYKFSENEKLLKIMLSAGKSAEENFDWVSAAKYYDQATRWTTDFDGRVKLLLLSAYYYDMSNNVEKSIEIYSRLYSEPLISETSALEYRFKVAELFEKTNEDEKALKVYEEIVLLHEESVRKGGKGNVYYFAKSKLQLLEEAYIVYSAKTLEQPFEKNFSIKSGMMQALIKDYMETTALDIPEFTSASLFRIGAIFENFRDSIMASSPPDDFSLDEKEEYVFMLEEKAFPYEEKAQNVFERSITIGRKRGVTNVYLDKTYERLSFLAPAIYKRSEHSFETRVFVPEPEFIKEYKMEGESK